MTVRDSYVLAFGEEQADALERAAAEHENGVHDKRGSDPFKWVIAIAIGYECAEEPRYREYHGITVPFDKWTTWVRRHGDLKTHDGDVDYLAVLAGAYEPFMAKT